MRSGSEKVTLARFTKPLNPLHKTQVLEAGIIQGKVWTFIITVDWNLHSNLESICFIIKNKKKFNDDIIYMSVQ